MLLKDQALRDAFFFNTHPQGARKNALGKIDPRALMCGSVPHRTILTLFRVIFHPLGGE
jgi:hypothetical protein